MGLKYIICIICHQHTANLKSSFYDWKTTSGSEHDMPAQKEAVAQVRWHINKNVKNLE